MSKPEPCPPAEGISLPGGWVLYRRDLAGKFLYQGREIGERLETSWASDLKMIQKQAHDLTRARGPFYPVPESAKVAHCRSCGAKIIWTRRPNGNAIPLSVKTIEWRGHERYALSHFSDCPDAADWRQHQPMPEPAQAEQPVKADQLEMF